MKEKFSVKVHTITNSIVLRANLSSFWKVDCCIAMNDVAEPAVFQMPKNPSVE
jgi:hypothetical protein